MFWPRKIEAKDTVGKVVETVDTANTDDKRKILLVDDERLIIDLWKEVLNGKGYQVDWQATSFDAYQAFQSSPGDYDLVITELSTVNIKGLVLNELIKKIRPDIPVIILTGFSYPHDEVEAKTVGIRHFLYKPIKAEKLCQVIKQTLEKGTAPQHGKLDSAPSSLMIAPVG